MPVAANVSAVPAAAAVPVVAAEALPRAEAAPIPTVDVEQLPAPTRPVAQRPTRVRRTPKVAAGAHGSQDETARAMLQALQAGGGLGLAGGGEDSMPAGMPDLSALKQLDKALSGF